MSDRPPPPIMRWRGIDGRKASYEFLAAYLIGNAHRAADNGFPKDARILEAMTEILKGLSSIKPDDVDPEKLMRIAMTGGYDAR